MVTMTNGNLEGFYFPFLISLCSTICEALNDWMREKLLWPRSPNSIMKSILRMTRKWLSAKETAKGAPFQSCFLFRMFYVLIKRRMTFVLAGYLTTLDDATPTRVGHWLKSWGLLGPTDYFTNLGGGRDGLFLITRHSNVMFSLEVPLLLPPPH